MIVWVMLCLPVLAQGTIDRPLPTTWQAQAGLRDVHFVDVDHGWAVGDHGVILKTVDRGQHWVAVADANRSIEDWNHAAGEVSLKDKLLGVQQRRIQSGASTSTASAPKVSCQLNTVFFLNQNLGWAAGGYAVPLLNRTRSVILKTTDGGINWRVISNTMPPHMKQIRFSSPNNGWAVGDSSNVFSSGIFLTNDGGQTWQSQSLSNRRQRDRWVRADRRQQTLIGVTRSGELKFTAGNGSGIDNAGVLSSSKQRFNDVAMVDDRHGWAVGDFGAIFQTRDRGLSWQVPPALQNSTLPRDLIDFSSVTISPANGDIWAAGKPGGVLVSIEKQTGAVNFHATPITSAIHRIQFADALHGWAVGDLGIVIATTDGGQSWQIQRGTQTRVGCLNVCFDPAELPLELLAQFACEDDVLCATETFSPIDTHLQQSASQCGNAVLDRLDLPDLEDPHQQQTAVIGKLVTVIRTHRPDCIVLNPSVHQSIADSLDREKLLQLAVHQAADSTFEASSYDAVNLKPWQVQRMAIADVAGTMSVGREKFLPNLAATIGDRVFVSRSLLGLSLSGADAVPGGNALRYRVIRFLGRGAGGQSTTAVPMDADLLTGLHRLPRRTQTQHPPGNLSMIAQRNQKREAFKRIVATDVNDRASMYAWQNEMLGLMLMVDRATAGNWLLELADQCFAADKPELAAKTIDFLVQRLPEHAYTPSALLWLATYYASQEYSLRSFAKTNLNGLRPQSPNVAGDVRPPLNSNLSTAEVTTMQIGPSDTGDRQLAWAVPDADLLKRKIDDARRLRLAQDEPNYTDAEKKLFELGDAISGKSNPSSSATPRPQQELTPLIPPPAADIVTEQTEPRDRRGTHSWATSDVVLASAQTPVAPQSAVRSIAASSSDTSSVSLGWNQFVTQRRQSAAKYLARLRGIDPDLANSPETVAVEVTLLSQSDQPDQAIQRLQQLASAVSPTATTSALTAAIWQEIALLKGETAGETVLCSAATARPKLDGKFDDDLWRLVYEKKTFEQMKNSDVVFFAHDDEFFYLIARMNKRDDYHYAFTKKHRTRDANLANRDRILVALDCDRDGRTKFQLTIDHRGWVNESFDAVGDWDPQWFVSQSEDSASWTVEAAIPKAAFQFANDFQSILPTDSKQPWTIQMSRQIRGDDLWNPLDTADADAAGPAFSFDRRGKPTMLDLIQPGRQGKLLVWE